MSFQISTHRLKNVHSFEQAQDVWNAAIPWKNESESWRPLDGRRMRHKRLVKINGGYECVLYSTPLVTYFADGSVDLLTHGSNSSLDFVRCVAPPGCRMIRHAGNVYWVVTTDEGDRYYTQDRGPLDLTRTQAGNWRLRGSPTPRWELVTDPAKARLVNQRLKPFKTFLEVTSKLNGPPPFSFSPPYEHKIRKILNQQPEAFHEAYTHGWKFDDVRDRAYSLTGATTRCKAPFDRLPRNPA